MIHHCKKKKLLIKEKKEERKSKEVNNKKLKSNKIKIENEKHSHTSYSSSTNRTKPTLSSRSMDNIKGSNTSPNSMNIIPGDDVIKTLQNMLDSVSKDDFIPFDADAPKIKMDQQNQDQPKQSDRKRKRQDSPERPYTSINVLTPLGLPPWADPQLYYSRDPVRMLNEEIHDYLKYMSPTPEEESLRTLIIHRIEQVVLKLFPNAKVQVFGSFSTGLYLPSSDLDIVVNDASVDVKKGLRYIAAALKKYKIVSKCEVIEARVPIIKIVDSLCSLSVDISFNMRNGLESADIICAYLKDPYVGLATKALILIIKQFLSQRYLNEVFTGGLSSYSIVVMIVAFLKLHPLLQAKQIKVSKNLGVLLIEFFELYGKCLNYTDVGIGLDHTGGFFFKKPNTYSYRLSIQDPQDANNDISSGSFSSAGVRMEFTKAYQRITSMIAMQYIHLEQAKKPRHLDTILGSIITISRKVVTQRAHWKDLYSELMSESKGDLFSYDFLSHTHVEPFHSNVLENKSAKFVEDEVSDYSDTNIDIEIPSMNMDIDIAIREYKKKLYSIEDEEEKDSDVDFIDKLESRSDLKRRKIDFQLGK